jgi:hypothetical protein
LLGQLTVVLFVGGLTFLAWGTLRYLNTEFVLTNRRVVQVEGVVNKRATDSSLEKINDAVLSQSIFGRVFGFGDLDILTAAEAGIERFRMIVDPIGFKRAMLDAKSFAYAKEGATANHVALLFERLGIAEHMKPKLMPVALASQSVAKGEAELGLVIMSAFGSVPGIELIGPLPSELQNYVRFAAGASAAAKEPAGGKALIDFLKAPTAIPVLKAKGIESVLVTGVATNVCVETTARDAYMYDYYVTLVGDCAAAYDPKLHENTLENMRRHFGLAASSEEIMETWRGLKQKKAAGL